ncbi:MAG: DNA mismatch repair protein MutS [Flavobacteriales bacterium]|nr:MAG: DNA mismatch repair protein MutS [Flavobacteriales bacterium]
MKQYANIKAKYPDALLLFRVGDFYETFGQDAIKASKILGIVLTARNNGGSKLELAGFPYHSLDTYLPKLVRAGMRVAVCDQLEDPKMTKKIVKRGVTELVTPGVALNDQVLDNKSNNFLASVYLEKGQGGISFLDISTGEFFVAQGKQEYIEKLLYSFNPSEVIYQKGKNKVFTDSLKEKFNTFGLDDWAFIFDFGHELLTKHFGTASLKGFGVENMEDGIVAAGAALHYLAETEHNQIQHITSISRIDESHHVWLDKFTIRNLELFYTPHEGASTLIDVLDSTVSPMGARLLKRWLALPLKDRQPIEERLSAVDFFFQNPEIAEELRLQIKQIGDLERLVSKVSVARINPREAVQLKRGLSAIEPIKSICEKADCETLKKIAGQLNPCELVIEKIGHQIQPDPPYLVSKGNVINEDVSDELDELRKIAHGGKDYLVQLQQRESERTCIPSLKVSFNNVFGYFLEVTNAHKDKVPEEWIRKQTLTNAERYITEELKEYETKILGAEEKILALEARLFNELVLSLADFICPIQLNAQLIAKLDCLLSFEEIARQNNYMKPEINDSHTLDIIGGRHPVIEKQLPLGELYVANDVYLDDEKQQIIMITGPNMSGKSALLRQTALIVIMAQIGSFVPATQAKIGLVDKVFTRVGASDNISLGESTFMVEMNETASILNNLSERSLILLDEIGRGTSTYDGISIAWAISEYLHVHSARPKTLFATHYHELNEMAESFERIKNHNVSVKQINSKIIFLRKLVPGGSEHSFGIHVAKMAGMPKSVLKRANEMLEQLEQSHSGNALRSHSSTPLRMTKKEDVKKAIRQESMQLSFFQLDDPVLSQIKEEIENTDINTLTPVEALMKLSEIKKLISHP